jgi:hypothetical protein
MTKQELQALTDKGAIVKFTKKDGTERIMKCSTDWRSISLLDPNFKPPKPLKEGEEKIEKSDDPNSLMVWDIEKREYRKIIVGSVLEVKTV